MPPKAFTLAATGPAGEAAGIALARPRLGYPEALMTPRYGADALLAQLGYAPDGPPPPAPPAKNTQIAIGLPDPDVRRVELRVEVRALAGDTADDITADGRFLTVYRATRDVPVLPALPGGRTLTPQEVVADTPPLQIDIAWQDVPEIATLATAAPAEADLLLLPRACDVRVVMTPVAATAHPGISAASLTPLEARRPSA